MACLVSKMGLTTPLAQIVSVLWVNLWKVVMKCKNVFSLNFEPFISKCIFLRLRHFFSPSAYPINSILPVYKIHDFDEAFLLLAAVAMMNEIFFSLFPWQPFLGKQILSSQSCSLPVQTISEKKWSQTFKDYKKCP